jgi:hypothetical protein
MQSRTTGVGGLPVCTNKVRKIGGHHGGRVAPILDGMGDVSLKKKTASVAVRRQSEAKSRRASGREGSDSSFASATAAKRSLQARGRR